MTDQPDTAYEIDLTDVMECSYCHVPPGRPCVTRRGRVGEPTRTHQARIVWWDDTWVKET